MYCKKKKICFRSRVGIHHNGHITHIGNNQHATHNNTVNLSETRFKKKKNGLERCQYSQHEARTGEYILKIQSGNLMWFVAFTSAMVLFEKINFQSFCPGIFFFCMQNFSSSQSPTLHTSDTSFFQWSHIKTNRILIYVDILISHTKKSMTTTYSVYLFIFILGGI